MRDDPAPYGCDGPSLHHPFPDEPFGLNAFAVLFGPEAVRARNDTAQRIIGVADDGSLILETIDEGAIARMLEACAAYSGTSLTEVKAFLDSVSMDGGAL